MAFKKISEADQANFESLARAFKNGDACLMPCEDIATGEPRTIICAVERSGDEEEYIFVPFAALCWDNPYELWKPPSETDLPEEEGLLLPH